MSKINNIPKIPNISDMINLNIYKYLKTEVDSNQEDNILFQIERNQQNEIETLKELNAKKDNEIADLKINEIKNKKRFRWTISISTILSLIAIIISIVSICIQLGAIK